MSSAVERLTIVNDCCLLDGNSFKNLCRNFSIAFALNQINETNHQNDDFRGHQVSLNLDFARFELAPKWTLITWNQIFTSKRSPINRWSWHETRLLTTHIADATKKRHDTLICTVFPNHLTWMHHELVTFFWSKCHVWVNQHVALGFALPSATDQR